MIFPPADCARHGIFARPVKEQVFKTVKSALSATVAARYTKPYSINILTRKGGLTCSIVKLVMAPVKSVAPSVAEITRSDSIVVTAVMVTVGSLAPHAAVPANRKTNPLTKSSPTHLWAAFPAQSTPLYCDLQHFCTVFI